MRKLLEKLIGNAGRRVNPESMPVQGEMPELEGLDGWINSAPLKKDDLMGKVVLVDFWTYSCVNCLRTIPHLKSWRERYRDSGFEIIGLHAPEFEFERERGNVEAAVRRLGIDWPVALDNERKQWDAYRNRYWPAHYFMDRNGMIRYRHFGEGDYEHSEEIIRTLLAEGGNVPASLAANASPASDFGKIGTPETYLGFERMEYMGSPEAVRFGGTRKYSDVPNPAKNVFYLWGDWEIQAEYAVPRSAGAGLTFRIEASRVNLVMESEGAVPHRVEITLDDRPLLENELGADAKREGGLSFVIADSARMYELVNARDRYATRLLRLRFPEPGVRLYAFTFG